MRLLTNGLSIVMGCHGIRERVHALIGCAGYAVALARHGKSRPYVFPLVIDGLALSLDWSAAEHVPVREVLLRREYSPDASWLPRESNVVVDVGANAGVFAIDAARRVGPRGKVLAVEPNPAPLRRLIANARANGCLGTIAILGVAVAETTGRGSLLLRGSNTTTGRVVCAESGEGDVDTVTLDQLTTEHDIERIDIMKIDVEGGEVGVLKGGSATLTRTRRVVLEVEDNDAMAEVTRLLALAGFGNITHRQAGEDSGATLVFASRP